MTALPPLPSEILPAGVRARCIDGINGLSIAIERMQGTGCSDMRGVHLLEGAGHWVQQEKADEVSALLLDFLETTRIA
jgi:pimeloyl-ACP methyl ester carboxylesterase